MEKQVTKFIGIILLYVALPANATLIGDTIQCTSSLVISPCSSPTAVVGAGPEFSIDAPSPGMFIDFSDSSVLLTGSTFTIWFEGNLFTFSDLDWVGEPGGFIVDVILSGVSGIGGSFDQSDISFGTNSISIDPSGTQWSSSSSATLTIVTNHAVPVPATLALFGLGLIGLGWSRRRKV